MFHYTFNHTRKLALRLFECEYSLGLGATRDSAYCCWKSPLLWANTISLASLHDKPIYRSINLLYKKEYRVDENFFDTTMSRPIRIKIAEISGNDCAKTAFWSELVIILLLIINKLR